MTSAEYDRFWNVRLDDLQDDKPHELLYCRGDVEAALKLPTVAVVGARACSEYGAEVATSLGRELAAAGFTVVSGLARGIDSHAHRAAVEADGVTVGVMATGIDRIYPRANVDLAERILDGHGCVVSEYQAGTPPAPWRFPVRNRLIAALADAVVVVEARERSGALITADYALKLKRPLYAVPGEITSRLCDGTNEMIRVGYATLFRSVADLANDLSETSADRQARAEARA